MQDVDLPISPGSWFDLIGANGSGKTSLLRVLGGGLPFAGGSCWIGDEEMSTIVPLARCVSAPLLLQTSCRMPCVDAMFSTHRREH